MPSKMIDPTEQNQEEQKAEAQAFEQGKANQEALQADREANFEENERENQPPLIDGKFKSQDDLLAAYKEIKLYHNYRKG